MDVAILLYERVAALDAVGPYDVLSRLPGAEVRFVAARPGPYRSEQGSLGLVADHALADVPRPDLVVVPGGHGQADLMGDDEVLGWLRSAHEHTTWTTSVCTGALVLAGAGLLAGVPATTYWLAMDELARLGAVPTPERVVVSGKIVTAAGVSAGIDMALRVAALVAGDVVAQAIQLGIEYDPQPPFASGSPATAPPEVVEAVRRRSRFAPA